MTAVMLGMMVQSTPVTFGAVGTPILVGVRGGLDSPEVTQQLTAAGLTMADHLQVVTVHVAVLHAIVGTAMPLFMVMMMTRFFGRNRSWTEGLSHLAVRAAWGSRIYGSLLVERHFSWGPRSPRFWEGWSAWRS